MLKKLEEMISAGAAAGRSIKTAIWRWMRKSILIKLNGWKIPPKKIIKRPDQIDGIRESGLVNIAVLDYVAENISCRLSIGRHRPSGRRKDKRTRRNCSTAEL